MPVEQPTNGGRQRFAAAACRSSAYRRRVVGLREDLPRQVREGRRPVLRTIVTHNEGQGAAAEADSDR